MSLKKNSLLFAAGTFLSRLTGLLRESVIAGVFGAGLSLDAFIVANRIPNLLRELLAEGALGSSFTKVFSALHTKSPERAKVFLFHSLLFFLGLMLCVCALGIYFAPELVGFMTLFMNTEGRSEFIQDAIGLTRILFPFIGFMTIGSIASGVLHHNGRFFLSAISPIALNAGYILGALFLSQLLLNSAPFWVSEMFGSPSLVGLAVGVLIGGCLQMVIQLAGIWKRELRGQKLRGFPWSKDIKQACLLMGPMVIAGSAGQVNVLINTNFATTLEEGAVSWLMFSFRLLQLPIGLFAVAIGTAALPALTKSIARGEGSLEVGMKLQEAIQLMLWVVTPCLCFFAFNSASTISLIYEHGRFDSHASIATANALFAYSFALVGYGLVKVFTAYYYASDRTSFAMKVSLLSILVNFIANYLLVSRWGHIGLATSTSVTVSLNAMILGWGVSKDSLAFDWRRFTLASACIIGAVSLSYVSQRFVGESLYGWIEPHLSMPKLQSLIHIFINGGLVVSCFASFALAYRKL